jgi:hypothetical protein
VVAAKIFLGAVGFLFLLPQRDSDQFSTAMDISETQDTKITLNVCSIALFLSLVSS